MEMPLSPSSQINYDFRRFLQEELIRRSKANPRYSLRAFARFLGIQPNFLSKLLLGQRSVTLRTVNKLGLKLGLGPTDIAQFSQGIRTYGNGSKNPKVVVPTADYQTLVLDHYQVIADWYHFAILELATLKTFNTSPRWIARVLGITVTEANVAIERLERLDFIERQKNGSWKILDSGNTTTIGTELTSAALRKMQKQILEQALTALDETPVEKRDQTSMTMAIDSSRLPEAKLRITKFRRELCSFLESGKKRDQVYQLAVSLFPITKIENENGE